MWRRWLFLNPYKIPKFGRKSKKIGGKSNYIQKIGGSNTLLFRCMNLCFGQGAPFLMFGQEGVALFWGWLAFPSSCLEFIDCRPPGFWFGATWWQNSDEDAGNRLTPDTKPPRSNTNTIYKYKYIHIWLTKIQIQEKLPHIGNYSVCTQRSIIIMLNRQTVINAVTKREPRVYFGNIGRFFFTIFDRWNG